MKVRILCFVCGLAFSFAPLPAYSEKLKFANDEVVCVDEQKIVSRSEFKEWFSARLTSVDVSLFSNKSQEGSLTLPETVRVSSDPLFNVSYFEDLKAFMSSQPKSVTYDSGIGMYKVDVAFRPAAEVDSMRLIDLLLPGDGRQWFYVGVELLQENKPIDLSNLFLAMCWDQADKDKGVFCERRIPYEGVRVGYAVDPQLQQSWKEIDREVRGKLSTTVTDCSS